MCVLKQNYNPEVDSFPLAACFHVGFFFFFCISAFTTAIHQFELFLFIKIHTFLAIYSYIFVV